MRRICPHCKEAVRALATRCRSSCTLQGFDADEASRGKGCDKCRQTGYTGRLGIYELLVLDDTLRDLVTQNPDVTAFCGSCAASAAW